MTENKLEQIISGLRAQKIRVTDQRRAILEYMITHHNHPTAEDVFNDLKSTMTNISIATVYNNLRFLTTVTPIRELTYDDKSIHFDYFHKNHFHAICNNCQQVYDVDYHDYPYLIGVLEGDSGFEISKIELNVKGICKNCQKVLARERKS
ncbi:transcriptional repressor [Lactobacillus sp. DCY120]|uniref:Transcriptional repressor n=1 Tax=Bombilactobacillus apium TaxID=2675299 RepID=A0A850QYD8_9LACO|nr:Fur family transcriptional regulator [Bombilactobacillus apium]NVY96854.1 transcriptional repressor [Bombilactobacillus apium]